MFVPCGRLETLISVLHFSGRNDHKWQPHCQNITPELVCFLLWFAPPWDLEAQIPVHCAHPDDHGYRMSSPREAPPTAVRIGEVKRPAVLSPNSFQCSSCCLCACSVCACVAYSSLEIVPQTSSYSCFVTWHVFYSMLSVRGLDAMQVSKLFLFKQRKLCITVSMMHICGGKQCVAPVEVRGQHCGAGSFLLPFLWAPGMALRQPGSP